MAEILESPVTPESNNDNDKKESTRVECDPQTVSDKQSMKEALGIVGCTIVAVGSIITVAAMIFLIFLWAGSGPSPGGEHASKTWRHIMLKGWVTQAITLSTVIIRIALALQASICTSLVAALILENYQIPLSKVAQFTILRSVNGGPFTLVYLMSSIRALPLPGTIISLLFIGTLACQFASTILVSDLDSQSLVDFTRQQNTSFMLSEEGLDNYTIQFTWGNSPIYMPFGEDRPDHDSTPNEAGFSDTGVLRRAWLPFKSNITTVRNYAGAGWVMDSRVSCMRPPMEYHFEVNPRAPDAYDGTQFISGSLDYNKIFTEAGLDSGPSCTGNQCLPASFNCSIPAVTNPARVPPVFLCVPSIPDMTIADSMNSTIHESSISATSIMMMLLTSDGNDSDWNNVSGLAAEDFHSHGDSEWTVFEMGPNFTFNISLCFLTQTVGIANIDLSIAGDPKEPSIGWDIQTQSLDTSSVRNLMGMENTSATLTERGVFTINGVSTLTLPNDNVIVSEDMTLLEMNEADLTDDLNENLITADDNGDISGNQTFFLCYECNGWHKVFASLEYRMIFQDTLTYTRRPALALQTLFGLAAQVTYYERVRFFDTFSEVEIASSVTQRIPVRHNGLVAAIIITSADLLCILFITSWFLLTTRYTKQGNYWQAIAQVAMSSETSWILEKANRLTDKEVAHLLAQRDPKIKIAHSIDTGRVEPVKVATDRKITSSRSSTQKVASQSRD